MFSCGCVRQAPSHMECANHFNGDCIHCSSELIFLSAGPDPAYELTALDDDARSCNIQMSLLTQGWCGMHQKAYKN